MTTEAGASVLDPGTTAEEVYQAISDAIPQEADFSQHRRCSHWRS